MIRNNRKHELESENKNDNVTGIIDDQVVMVLIMKAE